MSQESTTSDLIERWRESADALMRGNFDVGMSFYAPGAAWDASDTGIGTFEGAATIRSFLEDWVGAFEEYEHRHEVLEDLGNEVVFAVLCMEGSLAGSSGRMQDRYALTVVWAAELIMRVIVRKEIEEARAAAEQLAEERGLALSANLDLVRSIYADWERGDFSRAEWAHPQIEYVVPDGPEPGTWTGIPEMAKAFRDQLRAWEDFRVEGTGFRELDDEHVLALVRFRASGKTSGVEADQESAELFHVRDGSVTRLVAYWDRERALADLGLKE